MWEAGWGSFACFTCFACCVFQYRYILYIVMDHQHHAAAASKYVMAHAQHFVDRMFVG
jgi:hypothetical protein